MVPRKSSNFIVAEYSKKNGGNSDDEHIFDVYSDYEVDSCDDC